MAAGEQRRFLAKIPKPKRSIGFMHLASGRSRGISAFSSCHLDTFCLYVTQTTKRVSACFFIRVVTERDSGPFPGKVLKSDICALPFFFYSFFVCFFSKQILIIHYFSNRIRLCKLPYYHYIFPKINFVKLGNTRHVIIMILLCLLVCISMYCIYIQFISNLFVLVLVVYIYICTVYMLFCWKLARGKKHQFSIFTAWLFKLWSNI